MEKERWSFRDVSFDCILYRFYINSRETKFKEKVSNLTFNIDKVTCY